MRRKGKHHVVEQLESRLLLANEFVGQQFAWGSSAAQPDVTLTGLTAHPNGFLATTISGSNTQLILSDVAGATIGTPVGIHPAEDVASGFGIDQLSASASGTSVVAWIGKKVVSGLYDRASFRLFNAVGQPQTPVVRVHGLVTNDYRIDVDMAPDGNFVITWTANPASPVIYARAFNASGQSTSPAVAVAFGNDSARVAALPGGGFEIVWQTQSYPSKLFQQRFSATGTPLTSPTAIPLPIGSDDLISDVEADSSGRTMVLWVRQSSAVPNAVYMSSYDANSEALSPPTLITDVMGLHSFFPSVSLDDNGRAIIAWGTRDGATGVPTDGIAARQMNINGQPIGAEFLVNQFQAGDQTAPFVAAKPGGFAIGWSGSGPSQTASAWGQLFDDAGIAADFAPSATFEFAGVGTFDAPCPVGSSCTYHQSVNIKFNSSFGWTPRKSPVIFNRATGQPITNPFWFYSDDKRQINLSPSPFATNSFPDGNYRVSLNRMDFGDAAGNPMASDFNFDFFALKGDLNRDRTVSIADFISLASNIGKTNATYAEGDLNYDGQVTISDFIDLAGNFNKSLPAPAPAVPQAPAAAEIGSVTSVPSVDVLSSQDESQKFFQTKAFVISPHHAKHHRKPPRLFRH